MDKSSSPLRIGIDARWMQSETSGISRYTDRLLHAFAQIDSKNVYTLFFHSKEEMDRFSQRFSFEKFSNFKPYFFPFSPFSIKGLFSLPREIKKLQLDLFHSTNFMIPLLAKEVKLVATIHDLIPFLYPHFTPKAKKTRFYFIYYLLMKWIGKKADLILTDSEHSRMDVIQGLKVPEAKVKTIYIGIEAKYQPSEEKKLPDGIKNKYRIQPTYFLYVGRHDPYKNILNLVKAYARYIEKVPFGAQLVVTGKRDPRYPEAHQWCEENNLLDKVVFTGFIDEEELIVLYQHAAVLILVSRYEGFGLPVLEAMACGTPVICSNVSSLPEVVGEAALQVSPDSIEEIADAMIQLYCDEKLPRELIQKGLIQAKKFSWQKCAKQTLEAYQTILS